MNPSKHDLNSVLEALHGFAVTNCLCLIEYDHRPATNTTAVTFYGPGIGYPHYLIVWKDVKSIDESYDAIIRDMFSRIESTKGTVNQKTKCKPHTKVSPFDISKVIFNDPATIVFWADGTKTVVKCQGDDWYSEEAGLALCFMKKALGNQGNYNDIFRKWLPETTNVNVVYEFKGITDNAPLNDLRKKIKAILEGKEVSDS